MWKNRIIVIVVTLKGISNESALCVLFDLIKDYVFPQNIQNEKQKHNIPQTQRLNNSP